MAIDNSSCLTAITTIKDYITNCFAKCSNKGSTFNGVQTLSNLESAINLIPQSGGSGSGGIVSENITGGAFTPFNVTWAEGTIIDGDYVLPNEFTITFGSVGVTWKTILCYSDTKDGHFGIQKLPNNKCIISASSYIDSESMWEESTGIIPYSRGTYRASYQIVGNSIVFTNAEYDSTANGISNVPNEFRELPYQVSNEVNDYYINQYKLNKITVTL